jgi:hypothetical protein
MNQQTRSGFALLLVLVRRAARTSCPERPFDPWLAYGAPEPPYRAN